MSTQMFACPACGSRKALPDFQPGEKIHCSCGMSYPASPVFTVAEAPAKKGGRGWMLVVAFVAMAGVIGSSAWQVAHKNRPPNSTVEPVAVNSQSHEVPQPPQTGDTTPADPPNPEVNTNPPAPPPPQDTPPNPMPPPPPPPTPVASLAAVTLWDAFGLDPNDAAAHYTGKFVEVTARGKVASDSLDRPYFGAVVVKPSGRVTARMSPDVRQWEKEGYPPSVRCYLLPEQAAALEKVGPDQDVVIRGTCTGRKGRENVYLGYIVELTDCTVMAPK
jgi:hypothetical protein